MQDHVRGSDGGRHELLLLLAEILAPFLVRELAPSTHIATTSRRVKAAEMLGISRKSLWEKLRTYEVDPTRPKTGS